jgi:hypothetical protein
METAVRTPTNEASSAGARSRARLAVSQPRETVQSDLYEVGALGMADLSGLINTGHGRMVEVMADVLEADAWVGYGILSPRHWLCLQAGVGDAVANAVVAIARRRGELHATVRALVEGRISLELAALIGRYVPGQFEADALKLAELSTVRQFRRMVSQYGFDFDADPTPAPAGGGSTGGAGRSSDDAGPGPDGADRAGGEGDVPGDDGDGADPGATSERGEFGQVPVIAERRDISMGADGEGGWTMIVHLPLDEGAQVERAFRARRDDLYADAVRGLDPNEPRPTVSLADALVSIADEVLAGGLATTPGADRYLILAHLTAAPAGGNNLGHHLGVVLPDHLRRLNTCDGRLRPVWERDGAPCNVGRTERIVPDRVRRLIEHRDGGCAIPGCERRVGLEVHHIVHWEDGGPTDTGNLVTLCRRHHREHHRGVVQIDGNADRPRGHPEGLRFADRWGNRLRYGPRSTAARPRDTLASRAAELGLAPVGFKRRSGERFQSDCIVFNARPTTNAAADATAAAGPASPSG